MTNILNHFSSYIFIKTFQHMQLSLYSLFLSILIAVPLGVILAKSKHPKISAFILKMLSILQTIPGLALIALIVSILVLLRKIVFLPATGFLPAIIVLSLYAILPILANTYYGIKEVNPTMIDVAKGMGMTSKQILFSIELPLALTVILTGIRISLVWTIGMATLTSLVGSGGLGDLIMQGLRSMQIDLIIAGTVPAAILAIFFDWLFSLLGKWLTYQPK
ncbi:MAG: Carnitine transport permease protein OpuCB [Candidatus Anoxychlamydiales bacterium]|nr:Carnitine transport permease protein OpuCB [Candidatus Anoxychlamydiales bacterium]NGX40525.1 Carnitine transport permease protein OpuCB [Candidatus Anoxychlamydiales bacterium]HEU64512.1 ABC transporter permease [Chlamydiota bacterium]